MNWISLIIKVTTSSLQHLQICKGVKNILFSYVNIVILRIIHTNHELIYLLQFVYKLYF